MPPHIPDIKQCKEPMLSKEDIASIKAIIAGGGTGGAVDLNLTLVGNTLDLTNGGVSVGTIDLAKYLDDTTLSRVVSGVLEDTGIVTLTRDDGTTLDIDMSTLVGTVNTFTNALEFKVVGDELKLELTLSDGTIVTSNTIKDTHVTNITLVP